MEDLYTKTLQDIGVLSTSDVLRIENSHDKRGDHINLRGGKKGQVKFDYVCSFSLFPYLSLAGVLRCFEKVYNILNPQGKFCFAFYACTDPNCSKPISRMRSVITFADKVPYHHKANVYKDLAKQAKFKQVDLVEWDHPKGMKLIVAKK